MTLHWHCVQSSHGPVNWLCENLSDNCLPCWYLIDTSYDHETATWQQMGARDLDESLISSLPSSVVIFLPGLLRMMVCRLLMALKQKEKPMVAAQITKAYRNLFSVASSVQRSPWRMTVAKFSPMAQHIVVGLFAKTKAWSMLQRQLCHLPEPSTYAT